MDGFASVLIFLIFLAVTFSRNSIKTKTQAAKKPIIPIRKKDPWAPDAFVSSSQKPKSMISENIPYKPNIQVDRIVSEDNFWSSNESDSYFNDQAFQSLENRDIFEGSKENKEMKPLDSLVSKHGYENSSPIFSGLTSKTLVQAIVMNVILERPLNGNRTEIS